MSLRGSPSDFSKRVRKIFKLMRSLHLTNRSRQKYSSVSASTSSGILILQCIKKYFALVELFIFSSASQQSSKNLVLL